MRKLTVYHGSPVIIEKPQFGVGNPNNDYGLGFYCTETLDLAKEWACSAETDGYANKYTLDMSDLAVLSLTGGDYNILNWLAILMENRKFRIGGDVARQARAYIFENFGIDYKKYDGIKGYRADDSYFSFASAFLNNTISLSQLGVLWFWASWVSRLLPYLRRLLTPFPLRKLSPLPRKFTIPRSWLVIPLPGTNSRKKRAAALS